MNINKFGLECNRMNGKYGKKLGEFQLDHISRSTVNLFHQKNIKLPKQNVIYGNLLKN